MAAPGGAVTNSLRGELHTELESPQKTTPFNLPYWGPSPQRSPGQNAGWAVVERADLTAGMEWRPQEGPTRPATPWGLVWKYVSRPPGWGVRVARVVRCPYKGRPGHGDAQRSWTALPQPNVRVSVVFRRVSLRPHGPSTQTRPECPSTKGASVTAGSRGTLPAPPSGLRGNRPGHSFRVY